MKEEELIVGGFVFKSLEDAQLAKEEEKKIAYLEERIDFNKVDSVLAIYQKMLENHVFKTPIGYSYLQEIQKFLKQNVSSEEISDIPIDYISRSEIRVQNPREQEVSTRVKEKGKNKQKLRTSIHLNIALIIVVILMFFIAMSGNNPNVLNYEKKITDKYAAWEQELTEREQQIREKELSTGR